MNGATNVVVGPWLSDETAGGAAQMVCQDCSKWVLTLTFAEAARRAVRHHRATGHTVGARIGREERPAPAA